MTIYNDRKCMDASPGHGFNSVEDIQKCLHLLFPKKTEKQFDDYYKDRPGRGNPDRDLATSDDDYVDGLCGPVTKSTIAEFQGNHNLPATGVVNAATAAVLRRECDACKKPKPPPPIEEIKLPEIVCGEFNEQCYLVWNMFRKEIIPYYIGRFADEKKFNTPATVQDPLTIVDGDPADFLNRIHMQELSLIHI